MKTHKWLVIGAGGMAGNWLRRFLPAHGERVQISGIVDVNADVLEVARHDLGLRADQCFTKMTEAFDTVDADAVAIVVPPQFLPSRSGGERVPSRPADPFGETDSGHVGGRQCNRAGRRSGRGAHGGDAELPLHPADPNSQEGA
ncbi:MAG: hypothetical protein EBS94_17410 [Proteobacteria bacterium]|nr:hypothetical protein [Pseudomonadota bacterium]